MEKLLFDYGMIGLGTMGRNLLFNMSDHGYSVAGFDKDPAQLEILDQEKNSDKIFGTINVDEFLKALKQPRVILLLVPAGPIVDSVIAEIRPLISGHDLIMDCGNSHFTDTDRRIADLAVDHIQFMGVGVSGGEFGARYGPSIMPGGEKVAYDRVAPMLRDISAKVNGEPCVSYTGRGSSGHYVKMVHNGIEYSLMQLIAESYHLLKEVAGLDNEELQVIFSNWNTGQLQSYLIGITASIFAQKDDLSRGFLIDVILDNAHQKGTGKWMSQNAMDLQTPVPAVDAAVSARDLSGYKHERMAASQKLTGPDPAWTGETIEFVDWLENALYFSMITTYAQGISLLKRASDVYHYDLNLAEVIKTWRGGCIIRAAVLENILAACREDGQGSNLMMNDHFAEVLTASREDICRVVITAANHGIPIPGLMASLAYFDGYRNGWLPSNLLQAQRDFFGAHTYQRVDREGDFHTQWNQKF